jgi:hypothetical protein
VHDLWSFNVVYCAGGVVLREDFDVAAAAEAAAAAAAADHAPTKHVLGVQGEQSTDERLQIITDRSGKEWALPPCVEDILVGALFSMVLADEPPVNSDPVKAIKTLSEAGGERRRDLADEGYYGEDRPTGVKAWFAWGTPPASGFEVAQANEVVDNECVEPMLRCLHAVLATHPTMHPIPRSAARRWCGVLTALMMSGRRGHTVRAWASACIAVLARQCDLAAAAAFGWEVPPPLEATGGAAAGGAPISTVGLTNDPLQRFTVLQIVLAIAAKVKSPGAQACAAAAAESILTTLLKSFNDDAAFVQRYLPQGSSSSERPTVAAGHNDATVAAAEAMLSLLPVVGVQGGSEEALTHSPGPMSELEAPAAIAAPAWFNLLVAFHPRLTQTLSDLLMFGDSATRLHASACATCLSLTGPVAVSSLQQVGLVEALTASISNDEIGTKNSVLTVLLVMLNSSRYAWPPAGDIAASDKASASSSQQQGDAGVMTLVGGWSPHRRASFVRLPPCAPLLRAPSPWEACAKDISRLGCVYVLADTARSKGTRRVMGMQQQMDRAALTGELAGAGVGELQFPLAVLVMDALAACGHIGKETAQRGRW